jgi:aspartyl-tRNA(Asn)/glutamyl-tRNA(Gln) amidotransferase subunit C
MPDPLSLQEVRHVAKLARLRLGDGQLQAYRRQLSSVLEHLARLDELDTDGVEPMAHPSGLTDQLDQDVVAEPMPTADLLDNAPAVEGQFLAVPKVLDEA